MSQQFLKTTSGRTLVLPSAQDDAAMAAFKATGAGWQTRIDAALKD
ncbi:BrnA antitoxin family protein [Simplicispira psychrophila]|nr:BrnA antitoxin family protein [Simplicispira psychrophila]